MERNLSLSISLPFTTGVALASALDAAGIEALPLGALSCILCVGSMVLCVLTRRHEALLLALMLCSLGVFCHSTALLGSPAAPGPSQRMEELLAGLRGYIGSIPFKEDGTAALLEALMTGDKSALPAGVLENFRKAGASHLLALSGLHLGVLAGFLGIVLSVLGKSKPAEALKYCIVIGASSFYTLLCGASPSLVRALLFIVLASFSKLFPHRHPEKGGILCTALTLQLAFSPLSIASLAFQMSYLAVAGIAFILPVLERWLWNMMALPISCQITTAPLAWIRFHSFPVFFLLTNLLAMPVCELLMVVAALTLMGCDFCVGLCDWLARLLLKVLEIIASL